MLAGPASVCAAAELTLKPTHDTDIRTMWIVEPLQPASSTAALDAPRFFDLRGHVLEWRAAGLHAITVGAGAPGLTHQ